MTCVQRYPVKADAVALTLETDPCVDEFETTPPTATDIMNVVEDSINITFEYDEAESNAQGGNFGQGRSQYDAPRVNVTFDVFASGPGAAGATGVPYRHALGAAAFAESGLAPGVANYTIDTTKDAPITIWVQLGSMLIKAFGCRGSVMSMNEWQDFRKLRFTMTGQAGNHAVGSLPAGDFSAWQDRVMITAANRTTWNWNGTDLKGRTININSNAEISQVTDDDGQIIRTTDWAVNADMVVADDGVTVWPAVAQNGTAAAMNMVIGTQAGNIMTTAVLDMQIRSPTPQNVNNFRYWGLTGRITNEGAASGDDVAFNFS